METPLELWSRYAEGLLWRAGVGLDLSRIPFPPGYLAGMEPAIRRALEHMQALERGAIANPDEKRRVGHYWLRAPELAPDPAIGRQIQAANDRARAFARRVHSGEIRGEATVFRNALVIGIGGSALGPQLAADALGSSADRMRLHFFDNTDPDGFDRTLAAIQGTPAGLDGTLVVVISKSGGTRETRNGMLEAARAYERAGLSFSRHAIAVTGEDRSALGDLARAQGWLDTFPMWDWVGGRTSLTALVGLLPALLQGIDVDRFLAGARAMDEATRDADFRRNPAMLLALAWHLAGGGAGAKDMVILPYKDRLVLLSRYLQQLIMESLGKERNLEGRVVHQGIAVYGNKGSTDQHSYVQQLREGIANFFVTFIEVLKDRDGESIDVDPGIKSGDYLLGFLLGTRQALHEKGRQSITLTIEAVTPDALGALIALYERAVGLYAALVGINAYHQPGVEAGKKAAERVIALQAQLQTHLRQQDSAARTAAEIAAAMGTRDEVETVYRVLEHLAANGRGAHRTPGEGPATHRYSSRG